MRLKTCLILLAALMAACAEAQTYNTGWSMRYVKEHHLMTRGAETRVVDIDLEWPDEIDFQDVEPLRTYLAGKLFDVPTSDFPTAYRTFMERQGEEVTRQFDSIPDDDKFCYTELKLTYLGGVSNRYASFRLSANVSPMAKSSLTARQTDELITYDLATREVLRAKDLLRSSAASGGEWKGDLFLLQVWSQDAGYHYLQLSEGCLLPGGSLLVYMIEQENDGALALYSRMLPLDFGKRFFTKKAKQLTGKKQTPLKIEQPNSKTLAWVGDYGIDTDSSAMVNPRDTAWRKIVSYIGDNFRLPTYEQDVFGKAMVSFVLDTLGFAREPRIVKSVGPDIDRELVRTISMMPRQTPMEANGKKTCKIFCLPVRIDLR
ncbi:MAG: energy transducer TonB [Bacteroidales bacterium]|nr:energy transducer TonB [Bacteroidales bacterium]